MTRLVVVTAGTGAPSVSTTLGRRLADATVAALGRPVDVQHLEIRQLASDLVNHLVTHVPSERLRAALDAVGTASGVIAVTPVYNASYSGLFKLFFDALDEDVMKGRPVLLGATGGTPRHSLAIDQAMVPLFYYLRAAIAPTPVYAATDDWGDAEGRLPERIGQAAAEFAGLVATRPGRDHADEFASVPDFSQLLGPG